MNSHHHHQNNNVSAGRQFCNTPRRSRPPIPKKELGHVLGISMLILVLVALFVAIRGRHNEMVLMGLCFAFFAIALFSYGYWNAVNRGDGVWQYIGQANLQHQQLTNPNYHFDQSQSSFDTEGNQALSSSSFKHHPRSKVHMVAPPKMGGARLEIYTVDDDGLSGHNHPSTPSSYRTPMEPSPPPSALSPHHHRQHHHHHHHQQQQRHHRRKHRPHRHLTKSLDLLCSTWHQRYGSPNHRHQPPSPLLRFGRSCGELPLQGVFDEDILDREPVKCEVLLPQDVSNGKIFTQDNQDFTQVILPKRMA